MLNTSTYYSIKELIEDTEPVLYTWIKADYKTPNDYYGKYHFAAIGRIAYSVYRRYYGRLPKKKDKRCVYSLQEWESIGKNVMRQFDSLMVNR